MLKKYFIYLTLLASSSCVLQKPSETEKKAKNQLCPQNVFDNQGNKFRIIDNEIYKIANMGDTLFRYSSNLYGTISKLDISNPMRPLIYYKEAQKIIITDNTLSKQQQQVINLDEIELYQTITIANSLFDNGIWLYDQNSFQLIKINTFLKKTLETGNLSQLLSITDLEPIKMQEDNGLLYLECKNNGIMVFDMYGTFYKNLGLVNVEHWNIENEFLYFITDSEISKMSISTKEITDLAPYDEKKTKFMIGISSRGVTFCSNSAVVTVPFSEL